MDDKRLILEIGILLIVHETITEKLKSNKLRSSERALLLDIKSVIAGTHDGNINAMKDYIQNQHNKEEVEKIYNNIYSELLTNEGCNRFFRRVFEDKELDIHCSMELECKECWKKTFKKLTD